MVFQNLQGPFNYNEEQRIAFAFFKVFISVKYRLLNLILLLTAVKRKSITNLQNMTVTAGID